MNEDSKKDENQGEEIESTVSKKKSSKTGAAIRKSFRSHFTISLPIIIIIVALSIYFGSTLIGKIKYLFAWEEVQEATVTLLSNERMKFLVTDKLASQVIVENIEGSKLLGDSERVLIATVVLYYGIDLSKIRKESISKKDGYVLVKLPNPEKLDMKIDPNNIRIFKKRSGLNWIYEKIADKEDKKGFETLQMVEEAATRFFESRELLPPRSKLVNDINKWSDVFSKQLGIEIKFV